jgi:telomerase protein component 1
VPQFEAIQIDVPFQLFTPRELDEKKTELLNMVSAAMLSEPKASATSPLFMKILTASRQVAYYDPEFLLKLALYVRQDLNIRSTANYLLAMSSNIKECQPFMAKYYEEVIRLPSDWLEVVAIYMTLPDRTVKNGIPTCLRKAMIEKFPAFDEYQLGKYNKERNIKRKMKKYRLKAEKLKLPVQIPEKPSVTLKQMIRQLHMSQPPSAVMALLGKRYPLTLEAFRAAGLPGNFNPALAGTRLKLPVPETWETMLSERGNKASTWESLIDHKKLPFMAMLRNLRNLILTGVSMKHHRWAQQKLSNEDTIAMSRQFPFRFFSAYEVIPENQEAIKKAVEPKPQKEGQPIRVKKNPIVTKHLPTNETLAAYREALDQSVKHATTNNVDPIKGSTVVFCNVSKETRKEAPGARGMGGAVKEVAQLGYLLGLMCKYVCEECDFRIWSSPSRSKPDVCHLGVELQDGTILANMAKVAEQAAQLGEAGHPFPLEYLQELISTKKKIDNLLVLSHETLNPEEAGSSAGGLASLLLKYRTEVNPELLFVSVNLSGSGKASIGASARNPNDIMISGFSEQILRFIAERGGDGQLQYVQNIDEAKGINAKLEAKKKALNPEPSPWWKWLETLADPLQAKPVYPNLLNAPRPWRDVRVFISSTFLDMHGERDVLTRLVFPELKQLCQKRRINLIEVDLRWGITEEQSQHAQSIQLCLSEVQRSTFFVGMLGERYGWAPTKYDIPKEHEAQFKWLKDFPAGRSITELEFEVAGLTEAMGGAPLSSAKPKASFFYLRDKSFVPTIPEEHRKCFEADSSSAKEKMLNLKKRLVASGLPLRKKYPASWRGLEDGKPLAGNLVEFADLVFADLASAIEQHFPVDAAEEDECIDEAMQLLALEETARSADPNTDVYMRAYHQVMHQRSVQQSLVDDVTKQFYGRQEQLEVLHKYANPPVALSNWTPTQRSHMLVLHGTSGDGKTALMATFAKQLAIKDPHLFVLSHFCGAGHNSNDLLTMLTRLSWEIKTAFKIKDIAIPTDIKELQATFAELLKAASFQGRLIVLLDAVDELINTNATRAHALEWIPLELPCKFIISTTTTLAVEEKTAANSGFQYRTSLSAPVDNTTHNQVLDTIRNRKIANLVEVRMSPLSVEERTKFIRDTLLEYHKRLDERPMNNQMRILLRKTDCGKPIYVKVACEELRVFGVYEQVAEKIASMGPTTAKLFESVLQRLEADHTTPVVESLFIALLASRDGLNEAELAAATSSDMTSKSWQHLIRAITPFLRTTTPYWAIFHEQLTVAATKRYLRKGSRALPQTHAKIAKYLYDQADPARVGLEVWRDATERVVAELPYHLLGAGHFEDLDRVLTDLCFVESKAKFALTFDLVNDYQAALNPAGALEGSKKHAKLRRNLRQYLAFVKQNAFVLHADHKLTYQQAANEPDKTLPARKAFEMWHTSAPACGEWIEWMNKPQAHAACKMTYNALGEAMLATAVSPDGAVLAMAGKECVIKLFNARTGAELGVIPPSAHGHTQWIVSLAFSPDSRFMVSGSWDNTAKVWDVATRTLLYTLSGHRRRVNSANFSPQNGRYVVTASWDNCARIYDLMSEGKLVKTIREHSRPLNCAVFSPDERNILTASWDGTMKLIEANADVSTPHRVLKTLVGHKGSISAVAMSPNGLAIASASRDQTVAIWDALSGKLISSLSCHYKPVLSVAYSWDGQFLATTSADCTVRVFKSTLGAETALWPSPVEGAYMTAVCAHPTKAHIFATGSSDCNIYIWDATRSEKKPVATLEKRHNRPINCLDWSPCGKWIASCAEETTVFLWHGETYAFVSKGAEHLHPVNAVAFNPNTATPILASGCDGFDVRLWNYKTSRPHLPAQSSVSAALGDASILKGHESTVKWLSWHPKGKMLASASRDRSAKIWDTHTGAVAKTLRGHKDWLNSVCFSPDGQRVVTGAWDYHVKQWNLRLAEDEINPPALTSHDGPVSQVRYINGGAHFISAASDGKLIVWDAASSTIITVLHGHLSRINALTVLQDGACVTVSDDGTVRSWAPLEPIEIATLTGHANTVRSVAFAPASDGYLVYTASDDQTVKVWDSGATKHAQNDDSTYGASQTYSQPKNSEDDAEDDTFEAYRPTVSLPLSAHEAQINAVACLNGTDTVATASDDGTAGLWDCNSGDMVRAFAHSSGRAMRAVAIGNADAHYKMVFTGCDVGLVQGWDARAETASIALNQYLGNTHMGPVTSITYTANHLLTSGWDNRAMLWDLRSLTSPVQVLNSQDWLLGATFPVQGSHHFAAVGWGDIVYSQADHSTRQLSLAPKTDCRTDLTAIRFSNRSLLAFSSIDGNISFAEWARSGSLLPTPQYNFVAGAPGTRVNKLASTTTKDDVRILYTGGEDTIVRAYLVGNTSRPLPIGSFPCKAPVTALATDPDQLRIWAADRIGQLYLAETRSTN